MPRIMAKLSAIPTRLIPRPRSVEPTPQPKPKTATSANVVPEAR